ncbi:hypothetical protein QQM79_03705 [Marinobacteraceae bacterium S3BR75-40.1]
MVHFEVINNLKDRGHFMDHYLERVKALSLSVQALPEALKISESGNYSTYYAPFEYVNKTARLVICGITPGLQQAMIALRTAQSALLDGARNEAALKVAKETASFAGPMRKNLVEMLDHIGLNKHFGIETTASLFDQDSHWVHYTSALRNPVLVQGKNYSGSSAMTGASYLWQQIEAGLGEEIEGLPRHAVYVPLGGNVEAVFKKLARQGLIDSSQVLEGLPHPSGANMERIAYFCGRKREEDLSGKTNAAKLDSSRSALIAKVANLQ